MKVAWDHTDGLVGLDNSIAALSDVVAFDPVMVRALVVRGIAALSVEDYNESERLYGEHNIFFTEKKASLH